MATRLAAIVVYGAYKLSLNKILADGPRGVSLAKSRPDLIGALAIVSVTALVLFVALRSPLKDDIAWLLYIARRWLDGRELYVDVVEVNPPLIIWLSAIPVMITDALRVDARFVAIPFLISIVLGCAWWAATLLRPRGGIFTDRIAVFALIGSVLLIVPAGDLGQREHLLIAAALPYLVLLACELDGGQVPWGVAIGAGLLAGLGCALKPRYGIAFPILECLALARGLRPWRPLPLAAAGALLGYVASIAVLCPAYLNQAVPMALALYGATDVSLPRLLSDSAVLIAEQAVALYLLWERRRSMPAFSLMLTLMVFGTVSTAICLITGKDWYYHRLPAMIATILALLLWWVTERLRHRHSMRLALLVATAAMTIFCYQSAERMGPAMAEAVSPDTSTESHLEQIIRMEHARSYVAFSEWLAVGFPVVNETGVTWASRFDSMWALKGEIWRAGFDPSGARKWPIARWVANDFVAGCPDIAVVDTQEGVNYIEVLSKASPSFRLIWPGYRRIASFDGLDVYRHAKGVCREIQVAASGKPRKKLR